MKESLLGLNIICRCFCNAETNLNAVETLVVIIYLLIMTGFVFVQSKYEASIASYKKKLGLYTKCIHVRRFMVH